MDMDTNASWAVSTLNLARYISMDTTPDLIHSSIFITIPNHNIHY